MNRDYTDIINARVKAVFEAMAPRTSEEQMRHLHEAFELAREAHSKQWRKGGDPYILHPIAVAAIVAIDLNLGAEAVMAAFLHDVVEDTDYTIDDIRNRFGDDVAFLVSVVTKAKKDKYDESKQVDNYRQMLDSVQYDIRALLVKLADRLHNMRTLSSMPPEKQMKIAGETDYFYAPLANRLGLYDIKLELENLSFRFRCPHDYAELSSLIERDKEAQAGRLAEFRRQISDTLKMAGVQAQVVVEYRKPYSIWRKMRKYGDDFNHLKYRHFTDIIFEEPLPGLTEKGMALHIYSILTDYFKEKPGGMLNYIDSPKENGYQSLHVKLLAHFGRWQEVHISSRRMVRHSQLGCVAERPEGNINRWIEKFRDVLRDIARHGQDGTNFIDKVVSAFYNDDIMTFTPEGKPVILPQKAIVLDFAYEVDADLGEKAKYARVNGFLASVKSPLRRGDVVEVFTDNECHPHADWLDAVVTYKARNAIRKYLDNVPKPPFKRCHVCCPIPGDEIVGFVDANGDVTVHKRECDIAIRLASQQGDDICSIDNSPDGSLYIQTIRVIAVDRYHLFIDLVDCITNQLHLTMESFNTSTADSIVTCTISFGVHSSDELQSIISHISGIKGVDEVKRLDGVKYNS